MHEMYYLESKCQPGADQLAIYEVKARQLNQGQSKENLWSGLVKDMITGQRPYRV